MSKIQSWGRLSEVDHNIILFDTPTSAIEAIKNHCPAIAYGMGRSYGDVSLNTEGSLWQTTDLDHFISFDQKYGVLHCESGVMLKDIHQVLIPKGWMLPVTPGTQMITVGGAISNDVHGKNHHKHGTFGDHVLYIKLLRTNGDIIECSSKKNSEWFYATLGGIGLTGLILEAKIQLRTIKSSWIECETIAYYNIDDFFHLADSSEKEWEYTVSWVDCLAGSSVKGLFMRGNLSESEEMAIPKIKDKVVPFTPPISLVNRFSLPLFNFSYFHIHRLRNRKQTVYYESFLYPLDKLHNWNKMYGPRGFYQYQCVIPRDIGKQTIQEMLKVIKRYNQGSFLAVLKTFGSNFSKGLLSFPRPGVTLALDFPNQGKPTLELFAELDQLVYEAGGRLYLAKDMCMSKKLFEAGYPKYKEVLKFKDPNISSDMSRRLLGE